MKAIILTDGGNNIGFGHIARSMALYDACKANAVDVELVVNADEAAIGFLKDAQLRYRIVNWLNDPQIFSFLAKEADIVIIDSRLVDGNFYNKISEIIKVPVYLDDNKRLDYPAGIVVNGNIHAPNLLYPLKEGVEYLLGTKFTPLRKEFWNASEKSISKTVETVLLTFGGADPVNITSKVLGQIVVELPGAKKKVVIGRDFKFIDEIEKARDGKTEIISCAEAALMKKLMEESDLAISGGGQTIYELARIGLPAIVVGVAIDQFQNIACWEKTGFIVNAGRGEDKNITKNISDGLKYLQSYENRRVLSQIGRSLVDGRGALRVIEGILTAKGCLNEK